MPLYELENLPTQELIPSFSVRFIHTENVTVAYWKIKKGGILPPHSHIHEQISQVTKGEFELTIEGESHILDLGKIFVIPSNVEHSGRAISDCEITDIFNPVRTDYM